MEFFPDEIGAITERFDAWTAALQKEGGPDAAVVDQFVDYLQHYRCGGSAMVTLRTFGAARCSRVDVTMLRCLAVFLGSLIFWTLLC